MCRGPAIGPTPLRRCKSADIASDEELLELQEMLLVEGDSSLPLHRASGCERCGHSGYLGRLAVHEVMVMNDELRMLVLQHAPAEAIARAAVASGMQTLRQDAFSKVQEGETSFDELKRAPSSSGRVEAPPFYRVGAVTRFTGLYQRTPGQGQDRA